MIVGIVGMIGVPVLINGLSPVLVRRRDNWVRVGRLDDFPTGKVSEGNISRSAGTWPKSLSQRSVFIWRPSETALVVFSRSCTDLGCPLDYDAGSTCYFCPCHGGIFTQDGERLSGPPNRRMYRYAHRIQDGELEVDIASVPLGS